MPKTTTAKIIIGYFVYLILFMFLMLEVIFRHAEICSEPPLEIDENKMMELCGVGYNEWGERHLEDPTFCEEGYQAISHGKGGGCRHPPVIYIFFFIIYNIIYGLLVWQYLKYKKQKEEGNKIQ